MSVYSKWYSRERRRIRLKAKVCVTCGKEPAREGRTLCAGCKRANDESYRQPRVFRVNTGRERGDVTVQRNRIVKVPRVWREWKGKSWHLFKRKYDKATRVKLKGEKGKRQE